MADKPTYEELEQRAKELEREAVEVKLVEEALRESEQKYRSIFENIIDVYYRADLEGNLTLVSPSGVKLLGYDSSEEMIGKNIATEFYLDPQEREYLRSEIMKHGEIIFQGTLKRKDGTLIVAETNSRLIHDETGKPIAIEGIFRDITKEKRAAELVRANKRLQQEIHERRQAEEALRESESRYRTLVNSASDIIFIHDLSGHTLDFNQMTCERLGYSRQELLDMTPMDIDAPEYAALVPERINELRRSGHVIFETVHVTREGKTIPTEVSARLVEYAGKPAVLSIARDITERKQAEEALRKAHDQLELRVEERTSELAKANEDLKKEMKERRRAQEVLLEREKELEIKTANLEEANTALRVLLARRDEDRVQLEEKVLSNVNQLIMPYTEKLKKGNLDSRQEAYVNVLESNLQEVISPFSRSLSRSFLNLTPTEIQVSNLIKHGKSTKAIAQLLNVSERTIDSHRESIRRKLGIKREKVNLRSYLLSI